MGDRIFVTLQRCWAGPDMRPSMSALIPLLRHAGATVPLRDGLQHRLASILNQEDNTLL